MPTISRFYGIVIYMNFSEHPPPHFHARYAGDKVSIGLNPIGVTAGRLPPRALSMVLEWAALHHAELLENWRRTQSGQLPEPIEPL